MPQTLFFHRDGDPPRTLFFHRDGGHARHVLKMALYIVMGPHLDLSWPLDPARTARSLKALLSHLQPKPGVVNSKLRMR